MFKTEESCKGEGCNSIYIQNKKKHLCSNCVFKLNHKGKSQQEVYSERSKIKIEGENKSLKDKKEFKEYCQYLEKISFNKIEIVSKELVVGEIEQQNILNQNKAEEEAREGFYLEPLSDEDDIEYQKRVKQVSKIIFPKKKKQKSIKRKSSKQIEIDTKLRLAYADMDYTEEKVCSGCLKYQGGDIKLSHSHIISQKDCKQIGREDLIYDKINITYHCMNFGENEGCHLKHENPKRRHELKDYQKNIEFIKSVSQEMYLKYVSK